MLIGIRVQARLGRTASFGNITGNLVGSILATVADYHLPAVACPEAFEKPDISAHTCPDASEECFHLFTVKRRNPEDGFQTNLRHACSCR